MRSAWRGVPAGGPPCAFARGRPARRRDTPAPQLDAGAAGHGVIRARPPAASRLRPAREASCLPSVQDVGVRGPRRTLAMPACFAIVYAPLSLLSTAGLRRGTELSVSAGARKGRGGAAGPLPRAGGPVRRRGTPP